GQAHAAARPGPPVRRRGDHARPRAGEDDLRPRRRSRRARLGEAGGLRHASHERARDPAGAAATGGRGARDRGQDRRTARGCPAVVRRDHGRHVALLPRADAGHAGPDRRAAARLLARRADDQERPAEPADARAALLPGAQGPRDAQPRQHQGRNEEGRGRVGTRTEGPLRGPKRPRRAAGSQPRRPAGRRRQRCGLLEGDPRRGEDRGEPRAREDRQEAALLREGIVMGLHDRLTKQSGTVAAQLLAERPLGTQSHEPPKQKPSSDPYAELKTRIHHECIAKLGAELFKRETNEDLHERVLRAVTEQLTLDGTPLTREERRQLTAEITDDILGYGPLDALLRDDTVTEVMVNAYDRVYV